MSLVALVDCNNFFVSCERVFDPSLSGRPVVVLSSNDGCVVSRSNEAKELGIPMGAPYFQFKKHFDEHKVAVFSSNFPLYSDMSDRVMAVLERFSDSVQVYSVDESFLEAPDENPIEWAKSLRETVLLWTGIPVSVGIARTKTLAKVASKVAKKGEGASFLKNLEDIDATLDSFTPGEIWGIGGQYARLLERAGLKTARAFRDAPDEWVRAGMGVTGLRVAHELRGIPVFSIDTAPQPRQSIRHSRSFGKKVTELRDLEYAVALHIDRAAASMRSEGSAAASCLVFVGTPKHSDFYRTFSAHVPLERPTSDTSELIAGAVKALRGIFRPGLSYGRAGIVLGGLIPEAYVPRRDLFGENAFEERLAVMKMMDIVNAKYGDCALRPACVMRRERIAPRHQFLSRPYTTSWSDILKVRI